MEPFQCMHTIDLYFYKMSISNIGPVTSMQLKTCKEIYILVKAMISRIPFYLSCFIPHHRYKNKAYTLFHSGINPNYTKLFH